MNRVRFVGLDVHAKPIAVESQRRAEVRSLDSPRDTGGMRPVACSNVGRMASCAILAMRTVSRRCLGKSAQITYCRQCAVMVQFFYELHDHGQKVMAEIPLSRGSDPQSPSPNQVAPMWSATSCTPALCMTCQRSTT